MKQKIEKAIKYIVITVLSIVAATLLLDISNTDLQRGRKTAILTVSVLFIGRVGIWFRNTKYKTKPTYSEKEPLNSPFRDSLIGDDRPEKDD